MSCPPIIQRDAGNAVRIGDGCATVTDDKLPKPPGTGRRERGLSPKSGYRSGCARQLREFRGDFSAKRRMRPVRFACAKWKLSECLYSLICWRVKAFAFLDVKSLNC